MGWCSELLVLTHVKTTHFMLIFFLEKKEGLASLLETKTHSWWKVHSAQALTTVSNTERKLLPIQCASRSFKRFKWSPSSHGGCSQALGGGAVYSALGPLTSTLSESSQLHTDSQFRPLCSTPQFPGPEVSPRHIPGSGKISALTYFYSCSQTPDVCHRCFSVTPQRKRDGLPPWTGSSLTTGAAPAQRKPTSARKLPLLHTKISFRRGDLCLARHN